MLSSYFSILSILIVLLWLVLMLFCRLRHPQHKVLVLEKMKILYLHMSSIHASSSYQTPFNSISNDFNLHKNNEDVANKFTDRSITDLNHNHTNPSQYTWISNLELNPQLNPRLSQPESKSDPVRKWWWPLSSFSTNEVELELLERSA